MAATDDRPDRRDVTRTAPAGRLDRLGEVAEPLLKDPPPAEPCPRDPGGRRASTGRYGRTAGTRRTGGEPCSACPTTSVPASSASTAC
ncbi:hypothetical protein GCM10020295_15490 [Streptomyces cinereospinus]